MEIVLDFRMLYDKMGLLKIKNGVNHEEYIEKNMEKNTDFS